MITRAARSFRSATLVALILTLAACAPPSAPAPTAAPTAAPTSGSPAAPPKVAATAPPAATASKPAAAAKPKERVKFRMGVVNCTPLCGFRNMPLKKGFFAEEGIDLEYVYNANPVNLTKALIAGEVEVIEISMSLILNAAQEGDVKFKVLGSANPQLAFNIYSKKSIASVAELRGKVIGISSPGALPHEVMQLVLKGAGIPESTVTWLPVGDNTQRVQALIAGNSDAAISTFDLEGLLQGTDVKVLARTKDLLPSYVQNNMIVMEKYFNEHQDVLERYMRAYSKGMRYALEHPDEAASLASEMLNQPVDRMRPEINRWIESRILTPNFAMTESQAQYMIELIHGPGKGPKPADVLDTVIARKIESQLGRFDYR